MISRRVFLRRLSGTAIFTVTGGFPLFGMYTCTATLGSVESDLNAWVPLGLDAFDGVLALFDPPLAALLAPDTTLVIAGLNAIETAISDWEAADATQKPGLVGDIIAGIQTAEKDIGNFLAAVGVSAPALLLPAKALANIILGILQYFANKLSGSAATAAATITTKSGAVQVEPLNLSQSQFQSKFDAKADSLGHPEARGQWGRHKHNKKKKK
jgi:hypothetical protein